MIYITRKETFNAAHRMFLKELSDDENLKLFGKCSNPNWHGHNYTLFVTVCGEPDSKTGILINLKKLSELIKDKIIDKIDHKNLNVEVDFMKDKITSTENIAISIFCELKGFVELLGAKLFCVKLYETENNFVEYYG